MVTVDFPYVTTIITDRDTAVTGRKSQQKIKRELGIDWIHLMNRDKAFLAEEKIGFLKARLAAAMKMRTGKLRDVWVDLIPGIVLDFNRRFVSGTRIRRVDVNKYNQLDVLRQHHGIEDPTLLFNNSVVGRLSETLLEQLGFKYRPGDRVLLSTTANYALKQSDFEKKSVSGTYGERQYRIKSARLKSNRNFFLSPVYQLIGLKGYFYKRELVPAYFDDDEK